MILGLKTRQSLGLCQSCWRGRLWAGLLTFSALPVMWGQPGEDSYQRIDGIVAVVGDEIVLASDIRERVIQAQMEGNVVTDAQTCSLLESILFEKLLVHNARLDSLDVTEAEVMGEIDRRLTYYLQMFGTLEAFEAEYGKSVAEWKADFQEPVWEQLMAQKMQAEIDQSVRSTPAQVQAYFESLSVDSLPLIPEELSYSELVLQPEVGERQKLRTRNTLDSIRTLVVTGKMSMTLAATRYSEDPGSSQEGGELGWSTPQTDYVKPFKDFIFTTGTAGVPDIIETAYGFHIIEIKELRGRSNYVLTYNLSRFIDASSETADSIDRVANEFFNTYNSTDSMAAGATKNGYVRRTSSPFSSNQFEIPGIPDSRNIITWAFASNKGEMNYFNTYSDRIIIAGLTSKRDKGVADFEDVKEQIRAEVIRRKKGELLATRLADAAAGGRDLNAIATSVNSSVKTSTNASLGTPYAPGIGLEQDVVGEVMALGLNEQSEVIIGNRGVYLCKIIAINEPEADADKEMNRTQLSYGYRNKYSRQAIIEGLIRKADVEDNRFLYGY